MTKAKIGDTGTLEQLGVQAGDVVEFVEWSNGHSEAGAFAYGKKYTVGDKRIDSGCGWFEIAGNKNIFQLISRGAPQAFNDMTDAEKGALLLAKYRGEVVQMLSVDYDWKDCADARFVGKFAYRVKPKPVVDVVDLFYAGNGFTQHSTPFDTHKLIYNRVDGEIDCASAVLVKL